MCKVSLQLNLFVCNNPCLCGGRPGSREGVWSLVCSPLCITCVGQITNYYLRFLNKPEFKSWPLWWGHSRDFKLVLSKFVLENLLRGSKGSKITLLSQKKNLTNNYSGTAAPIEKVLHGILFFKIFIYLCKWVTLML